MANPLLFQGQERLEHREEELVFLHPGSMEKFLFLDDLFKRIRVESHYLEINGFSGKLVLELETFIVVHEPFFPDEK